MPRKTPASLPDRDSALHILIVRLGAIGDVLMTSPVPRALHEWFPNARISWIVEALSAPFVQANPYVDEVIVIERRNAWRRMLRTGKVIPVAKEFTTFFRELRARKFDLAIDFQGLQKSGMVTWLSGASRRIGPTPAREFANRFLMTELTYRPPHGQATRLCQQAVSMLSALGLPTNPRRPVLQLPMSERAAAHEFLASRGLGMEEPYVACCLSSSRPQKDWVWSRWGELSDLLWQRNGWRTVFVGGPERRADTLRLVEGRAWKPISAVGHTTLLQSAAIVQDAALVVGVDTGLTYAGLATDTPTVALYGSTDPTWLAEEPCTAVCFHPMPCCPCGKHPACKNFDCMVGITAEEVYDTASNLLQLCSRIPELATV
ncbi:MAG: glycosyltransferase family 9 protein [Armatimonadota bacterium]